MATNRLPNGNGAYSGRSPMPGQRAAADRMTAARPQEIVPGVHWLPLRGVNVYFVRSGSGWVLIDAAFARDANAIRQAAAGLFGDRTSPAAILLTHGHPDHAGSAPELARTWGVPVYLDPDELPALVSEDLHCRPELLDPIGRFALPLIRPLPRKLRDRLLSTDGLEHEVQPFSSGTGVPGLAEWERVPTAGHSPGHVAFFRRGDRVLIAGDACLTRNVFSPWDLLTGRQRLALPPFISCWDWRRTRESVAGLARLEPRVLAAGHGVPMTGPGVAEDLRRFARRIAR